MIWLKLLAAYWQYVLIAILSVAVGVQSHRLTSCKHDAAEYRVQAEAREKALGETIAVQNRAVAALETESRNRIAKADAGLKTEKNASKKSQDEAKRLRDAASTPQEPSACPAGDAVSEVRKGLR